jgi:caffeoyl-CoA O-methyltransferase
MRTRVHKRPEWTAELFKYVQAHNPVPDGLLRDLKKETQEKSAESLMQVAASQGTLLGLLVKISGAKHAVEIGTFTGYSAICIARALPADGTLLTCDVDAEMTAIARRFWAMAGLEQKIELRLGGALDTLRTAPERKFDFAFIDADKENYRAYYEELLPRMPAGGVVIFDNTLWHGSHQRRYRDRCGSGTQRLPTHGCQS